MDRKQLCVANVRYKRPSSDEAKQMRNLLGYLTYRDSRDQGVKMVAGQERWVDHGMGGSVGEIARRCDDLSSDHVLTFSLVVNPNPQLIAMMPSDQREQFVRELTERMVDDFFEVRGLDTGCEYSYVLHHRDSDDPQAPGLHNPHTHVVLPGTVWSEESAERIPLYFSRNKKVNHIEMLHEVTEQNMTTMLDRYVGLDWEKRIDHLDAIRREQKQVTNNTPHGHYTDADGQRISFWGGARQIDEQSSAVGYYFASEDDDGDMVVEFRPVITGLRREYAEKLSAYVASGLHEYEYPEFDQLVLYREALKLLLEDDEFELPDSQITSPSPDIDL